MKQVSKETRGKIIAIVAIWIVVAAVTVIMVFSTQIYIGNPYEASANGYRFVGEKEEDGRYHYTVVEAPESDDDVEGDEFWVESGGIFSGGRYYGGEWVPHDSGAIYFSDGRAYSFMVNNDSLIWSDITPGEQEDSSYRSSFSLIFTEAPEGYSEDMLTALVFSHDRIEERIEHPYEWNGSLYFVAIVLIGMSTVQIFCDSLMNWLFLRRARWYVEADGEIRVTERVVVLRKVTGVLGICIGIMVIIWSFCIKA